MQAPDPLLVPTQAVTVALSAGFFSRLIWVAPLPPGGVEPDLEVFRRQLLEGGILGEEEAAGWSVVPGGLHGTALGVEAAFLFGPGRVRELALGPMFLHVDLSYFNARYQDEVRTPIYELLRSTLESLRTGGLIPAGVTVSLSTADGRVPLDFRFVGRTVVRGIGDLSMLARPLPREWVSRAKALYLANLLKGDEAFAEYVELVRRDPADASLHFALYGAHRARREGEAALASLREAAERDPGYGAEYLNLAEVAAQKGNPKAELGMLDLAGKYDSENPFISLGRAQALMAAGDGEGAGKLLLGLRGLPWSPHYQPELPSLLERLSRQAAAMPAAAKEQ